jgi:hypothetical protein
MRGSWLLVVMALAGSARADGVWRPFLFSADAATLGRGEAAIESGAGYNGLPALHAASLSDERRVETWIGAAVGVTRRIELAGSISAADGPDRPFGFGDGRVELRARLLEARPRFPVSIAVGAGYQVDPLLEHALTAVVAVSAAWGRLQVTANVRGAHYFHGGRDPLDVQVTLGAAVRATPFLRVGLEYVGDELESDDEDLEARGGRHYLGPTVGFDLADGRLQLTAGAGPIVTAAATSGLGRAAVAYRF